MIELQIKCLSTVLWPGSLIELLRVLYVHANLIARQCIPQQFPKHGQTVLHAAARYSKDNIFTSENTVKFLINLGINVNLQDHCGATALIEAAENTLCDSTENTVNILLNAGADIDLQGQGNYMATALMRAAQYSRIYSTENTVKLLINAGANINLQDRGGTTALMYAVMYTPSCSTKNTVKMLINSLVFEYMDASPIII
jgi:ankyrin repeat protein